KITVIDYDGRLYVKHTPNAYDVVDLSLADSAGLSSPGGFAIVEKYSYTREAMAAYMRALKPDGILSVTLWNKEEPPKSVLKLYATMAAAARDVGGPDISKDFYVAAAYLSTATVLYKQGGFTQEDIDKLNAHIYRYVNNGVYMAGFSTRQHIYERAVSRLFTALDELDARLASSRFLFGPQPLETDWRLFTTLVRFDAVYQIHFKCSLRKLAEYPNLWPYLRDLYQWPGVRKTVSFDEIRAHYYLTHGMLDPTGIVAVMPDLDFEEPPRRERI
ncbi:MAG: glutathione S-transferase C-terminal domain-containing protein, partial [Acidobacteriota bacterium]|nr:glutathione S-transferase C-terminal domain-containing protein [Acidobacteriota bacterium]